MIFEFIERDPMFLRVSGIGFLFAGVSPET